MKPAESVPKIPVDCQFSIRTICPAVSCILMVHDPEVDSSPLFHSSSNAYLSSSTRKKKAPCPSLPNLVTENLTNEMKRNSTLLVTFHTSYAERARDEVWSPSWLVSMWNWPFSKLGFCRFCWKRTSYVPRGDNRITMLIIFVQLWLHLM